MLRLPGGADWVKRQQERYATHGIVYWLALEEESGWFVGQAGVLIRHLDGVEEIGLSYPFGWPVQDLTTDLHEIH
jgi:hypothetical protein